MRIFRSFEDACGIRNPVVTTGSFDGVHIGHKTILNRLKMLAAKYDGESVLITFDPHPRKVLYPDTAGKDLKLINSGEEKILLLEKAGLDNVIIVNFTVNFSHITSEEFVSRFLIGILHARAIVVGFNHHFGFNKEGDYRQLWSWREKYGFEAEEIPEQEVYHESVSSTRIRQALKEGYIQKANAYLDHYYILKGACSECSFPGEAAPGGMYRVEVGDESKLIPPYGIYAVSADSGTGCCKGMAIIMRQDGKQEIFLDLFGQKVNNTDVTLYFQKKIHGALNLSDSSWHSRVKFARDEIADLIY
ncbi:MAG TPA: hypothetical protein VK155_14165 [Bacteroidales bacterium]|jgi:riboflavin kinase/FMN adenylyltransferase|nr:hypothetical protein [Bacteroidales bacterium]